MSNHKEKRVWIQLHYSHGNTPLAKPSHKAEIDHFWYQQYLEVYFVFRYHFESINCIKKYINLSNSTSLVDLWWSWYHTITIQYTICIEPSTFHASFCGSALHSVLEIHWITVIPIHNPTPSNLQLSGKSQLCWTFHLSQHSKKDSRGKEDSLFLSVFPNGQSWSPRTSTFAAQFVSGASHALIIWRDITCAVRLSLPSPPDFGMRANVDQILARNPTPASFALKHLRDGKLDTGNIAVYLLWAVV